MSMAPRLDLRQSQTLVMTPQLQQAIKLLGLPSVELNALVAEELERNPLLERDESGGGGETIAPPESTADPYSETATPIVDPVFEGAPEAPLDQGFNTSADEECPGAETWDNPDTTGFQDDYLPGATGLSDHSGDHSGGSRESDDANGLEQRLADTPTLLEHLERQIALDIADPAERLIAGQLLGYLDGAGYLSADVGDVAIELGATPEQVETVLARLQQLDPPGIFARSLRECLALQLKDQNRFDPAMEALLNNLELVARRDLAALRGKCGVCEDDLTDMLVELRALDPKPALKFDVRPIQIQIPDVLVSADSNGGWRVELNPEALPRVLINNRYYAQLAQSSDKAVKAFLAENLAQASWLVKALDQRARTVLRVATEIVRRQDGFFRHGIGHLKPAVLRDVAQVLDMHESTISRATAHKTILSPRGLFEMKYFFTQALTAANGESISAETVRFRIKTLIDQEPAKTPLSDETLVERLKSEGIDIARRTVAKYRESMNISSSVQRRKEKRAISA